MKGTTLGTSAAAEDLCGTIEDVVCGQMQNAVSLPRQFGTHILDARCSGDVVHFDFYHSVTRTFTFFSSPFSVSPSPMSRYVTPIPNLLTLLEGRSVRTDI